MSFILDALKKVDRRKTGSGEMRIAEEVLGRRRSPRQTGPVALIGIGLLSAVVTAGAMHFLSGGGAPAAGDAPVTAPDVTQPSPAAAETGALDPSQPPRNESGRVLEPTKLAPAPAPVSAAQGRASGDEAARGVAENAGASAATATRVRSDGNESEDAETDADELVLQGTSVLDGEPVAVVNDQRVFVGDRVAGAVVISIEAGRVVLELDGERVELTL